MIFLTKKRKAKLIKNLFDMWDVNTIALAHVDDAETMLKYDKVFMNSLLNIVESTSGIIGLQLAQNHLEDVREKFEFNEEEKETRNK